MSYLFVAAQGTQWLLAISWMPSWCNIHAWTWMFGVLANQTRPHSLHWMVICCKYIMGVEEHCWRFSAHADFEYNRQNKAHRDIGASSAYGRVWRPLFVCWMFLLILHITSAGEMENSQLSFEACICLLWFGMAMATSIAANNGC